MRYLLIDTMDHPVPQAQSIASALTARGHFVKSMATRDMDIRPCIGCNDCWLKTPGICAIKDDYEKILIEMLRTDRILFFAEGRLGFVSHSMKDVVDRILPLATMYLHFKEGQMRHISRYGKNVDAALAYSGESDRELLERWMRRFTVNMDGSSLGAFKIDEEEAIINALVDR